MMLSLVYLPLIVVVLGLALILSIEHQYCYVGFFHIRENRGELMRSDRIKKGYDRAPARAMLKAVGFDDEALQRPLVGVANTWIEIGPCNFHLRRLAAKVKEGIRAAGGTPMEFNTVSISRIPCVSSLTPLLPRRARA